MAYPAHEPTDKSRAVVRALAAFGLRQDDIARQVGITGKTLREHYREELDSGKSEANAKVAKALFEQAIGGNIAAQIFWLKSQAGWSERQTLEHSGGMEIVVRRTDGSEEAPSDPDDDRAS